MAIKYDKILGTVREKDSGSIAIGDTVTSGTQGSVLYIGPGGVIAQDNNAFFWDDAANNLKLGVSGQGQAQMMSWSGSPTTAFWIDMPTTGPSGLGSGGAGQNAWIAYASGNGQWFTNATTGDINFRNATGKYLNFGTDSTSAAIRLTNVGAGGNPITISSSWLTNKGAWIDMPTDGPSGLGSGGPGSNAWIAYCSAATNWYSDSVVGDIAFRNSTSGKALLFGNSGGGSTMRIAGDRIFFPTSLATASSILIGGDTTLYRSAADVLATDDTFLIGTRLRLSAVTASSTANEVWVDSTQKTVSSFVDGIHQKLSGVIFTATADATVTNTVTETSIIGTGVGTTTLPANFFVAGKSIRLRIGGTYSTPAIGTPSVIVKVKYGSTGIATVTTSSLISSAAGYEFDGEVFITCRTTGSSGTVMVHGDIEYATGIAGTISVDPLNNGGATTTINTTTSNTLDVTIQWDTNTTTRIVKATVCELEVLN